MQVKLAMEIPTKHWDEFFPYTDFDYALCHEVLRNPEYWKKYQNLDRSTGREIWLDNSYNELREDIGIDSIKRAIDMIQPTHVVLPEGKHPLDNLSKIIKGMEDLSGYKDIKFIATWRGGAAELIYLYTHTLKPLIAIPYDDNRDFFYPPHSPYDPKEFHFFGFKSLKELSIVKPRSIDTSLPLRLAIQGRSLFDAMDYRPTTPLFNPDTLMTSSQLKLAHGNMKILMGYLKGEEYETGT